MTDIIDDIKSVLKSHLEADASFSGITISRKWAHKINDIKIPAITIRCDPLDVVEVALGRYVTSSKKGKAYRAFVLLQITDSSYNVISHNFVDGCQRGIEIINPDPSSMPVSIGNNITYNLIIGNGIGIMIYGGSKNTTIQWNVLDNFRNAQSGV